MANPTEAPQPGSPPAARRGFRDSLGDRTIATGPGEHELLEILHLRRELTAVSSFEFALRERTARLANFQHNAYARVRRIDRLPPPDGRLTIVSEHVPGWRLAEILSAVQDGHLELDINAALALIKQLVHAVAILHQHARGVAHGALGPERLVVTAHARLVVVEYVLGSAMERLDMPRERLWRELRVAVPSGADPVPLDARADVTQVGTIAMALVLGCPLAADDYPDHMAELLAMATENRTLGGRRPLSKPLRAWLARALQLDQHRSFPSAIEAQSELEALLLAEPSYVAAPVTLESFLAAYQRSATAVTPVADGVASGREEDEDEETSEREVKRPTAESERAQDAVVELDHVIADLDHLLDDSRERVAPPRPVADLHAPAPVASIRPAPPAALREPVPSFFQSPSREPARAPDPAPPREPSRVRDPEPARGLPTSREPAPLRDAVRLNDITPPRPPAVRDEPRGQTPLMSVRPAIPPAPPPPKPVAEPVARPASAPPAAKPIAEQRPAPESDRPASPAFELFGQRTGTDGGQDREEDDDDRASDSQSDAGKKGAGMRYAIAVAALVVLVVGGFFVYRAVAGGTQQPATGTLSVESQPGGLAVKVDGRPRGVTPLKMTLPVGQHQMEIDTGTQPRVMPVTITAGAQVSQYIEAQAPPATGKLQVTSQPPGATVLVDGERRGTAPVLVPDLAVGRHKVELRADGATVTQEVTIDPGGTSSLVVPVSSERNAPVSGWVSVSAPVELQVFEGAELLGTTQSEKILMTAGHHEVDIVNDALGFRSHQAVQVPPGKIAQIKVQLPKGVLNLNAIPWADVVVDGTPAGQTPIGNLSLTIGPHEILFRHPQLGEQRHAVTVTTKAPARLSVDLRK